MWLRRGKLFRQIGDALERDVGEDLVNLPLTNPQPFNLAQLEAVSRDDVFLLVLAHALEEQPRLGKVIAERLAALPNLVGVDAFRICLEATVLRRRGGLLRPTAINRVGLVGRATLVDGGSVQGIALAVVEGSDRAVDRDFVKVWAAESADLRVGVGKQPTLQQWIVGEVDAWDDVPRAKRNLLGFGEEIVRVAVQHHFAQWCDRDDFFRDQFGRVEDVEVEAVLVLFFDNLYAKFPFRVVPGLDGLPEIATVEVSVFTGEFLRDRKS